MAYNPKYDIIEEDGNSQPLNIEQSHHLIHKGELFFVYDSASLGSAASKVYTIITPSSSGAVHFLYETVATGECSIVLREDAVLSNNGTTLTNQNRNRNAVNTSTATITHTPTVTTPGNVVFSIAIGTGQRIGGESRSVDELVLKANTKYTYTVTSNAATNNVVTKFNWYVRELNY